MFGRIGKILIAIFICTFAQLLCNHVAHAGIDKYMQSLKSISHSNARPTKPETLACSSPPSKSEYHKDKCRKRK